MMGQAKLSFKSEQRRPQRQSMSAEAEREVPRVEVLHSPGDDKVATELVLVSREEEEYEVPRGWKLPEVRVRWFVAGVRKDGEELGEWVRRGARGLAGVVKESGRGFVFVAIGVGGLIVQAALVDAAGEGKYREEMVKRTQGVVFVEVPGWRGGRVAAERRLNGEAEKRGLQVGRSGWWWGVVRGFRTVEEVVEVVWFLEAKGEEHEEKGKRYFDEHLGLTDPRVEECIKRLCIGPGDAAQPDEGYVLPLKPPPLPRLKRFSGRDHVTEEIYSTFWPKPHYHDHLVAQPRTSVTLHGPPGAGKAALVAEFIHHVCTFTRSPLRKRRYSSLVRLSARQPETSAHDAVEEIINHYEAKWEKEPEAKRYRRIARLLGVFDTPATRTGLNEAIGMVCCIAVLRRWLENKGNTGWLLVVEDYEDQPGFVLERLIPKTRWGHVLVTTSGGAVTGIDEVKMIVLGRIGEEKSRELLLESAGISPGRVTWRDLENAKNIVEKTDRLPLILSIAGGCMAADHITTEEYAQLFKAHSGPPGEIDWLDVAYELSFQKLDTNAKHLLQLCSLLPYTDIPLQLLKSGKRDIAWMADEESVVNAVDRLVARSFAAKTSDEYGGSLAIHPLIQQRVRADLERDENAAMQTRRLAVYVITSSFVFDAADTRRNYERHILAHVGFCAAVFSSDGMEEDDRSRRAAYDLAQVYDRLHVPQKARSLYARAVRGVRNNSITIMELKMFVAFANNLSLQSEYDEALKWYARALEGTERRRGVESRAALDIVKDMATIFAQQGKYEKAIEERRKVLAILEKPLKKNYTAILDAKYRIALVLVEQRKYDDALRLLQEVKDGREESKLMGPEHSATLETRLAIARVLGQQDKFTDAIEEYQAILAKQKDTLGELSHASIDTMDAIAALYEKQGMYGEALTWYGKVLEGLSKLLWADEDGEGELHHPWVLSTASRMGDIYVRLGTYFDAEKLYRKAHAGFQALGKGESREAGNWVLRIHEVGGDFEVPGEFQTAVNLGRVLRHRGQYEEALSWSQMAEAGLEKNLGAEHPATLSSKAIIASILVAQGKYAQALKLYQLVLEHYKVSSGLQHPETLATICGLAGVFAKQGLYDNAAHYYQQAAAGQRQLLGPDHPQTLATVQGQADVYHDTGHHVEAQARYAYVAAARQELLGPEHPDTLHVVYSKTFASLLSGTLSLSAVLSSFKTVLQGWEKALGPDHPWITLAHHGIGSMHKADKAYELALNSFRRSLAGCQKSLGPTHPWTYRASCGVAGILCKKKQYDEAEKLYRQALAGLKDSLGGEHPLTCEAMCGIAGLLKKRRKGKEAMAWYRAAAEGHEKTFGKESGKAARSRKEVKRVKLMRWVGYVMG